MRGLLVVICSMIVIFLSACGSEGIDDPLNYPVQKFTMTDQNNKEFALENVNGKVWIANFIFTSCETICPPMTANMKRLQDKFTADGLDVEIVSFSVDPEVDTPSKLKGFIEKFQGEQSKWHLLTGYHQEFINEFAKESFHTIVDKPKNNTQVIHGTSFYLVDQDGIVQKSYSGVSDVPYDEVIADVKTLLGE